LAFLQVRLVRRDTGAKEDVSWDNLAAHVEQVLADIQKNMLDRAREELNANIVTITEWDQFIPALDEKKIVLAPWCDEMVREAV
jgi:prolyl-tRNA synthetase